MTDQETFDIAVAGVLAQGGPSMDRNVTKCVYRAQDGRRCAAGQLIPDSDYVPEMEGKPIFGANSTNNAAECLRRLGHNIELVSELQSAHDCHSRRLAFLTYFRNEARKVAARFGLSTAVLDADGGAP